MKSNDLLFVMLNGDKIMPLIDQFNMLLSHVGLPIAPTKQSAYSTVWGTAAPFAR